MKGTNNVKRLSAAKLPMAAGALIIGMALTAGLIGCDNGSGGGGEDASARYVGTYTLDRSSSSETIEDTFEVKADMTFTFAAGDSSAVKTSTSVGTWSVTGDYITLASADWATNWDLYARLDADNNLEVTPSIAGDPLWDSRYGSKTYTRQVTP
ncbi:MAG: hypothetical protein MdMp014T_3012 [Treponematales bacterium]